MNTQRVEGYMPMECPSCEHQWMHLSPDMERLEKVNEALVRALEDCDAKLEAAITEHNLGNPRNAMALRLDARSIIRAARKLAKEPA